MRTDMRQDKRLFSAAAAAIHRVPILVAAVALLIME
jgi:hypothetical protein